MMMKLVRIPNDQYPTYRNDVIFNAYKWDPQVGDHNTVSNYVLAIDENTASMLEEMAEALSLETMAMEEELVTKPKLVNQLGLPRKIRKELLSIKNYNRDEHIRLMRFDFHPTKTGWAISEVNSDVPGGFAEASCLPEVASKYLEGLKPRIHFGSKLLNAFEVKVPQGGKIGLVYATSYSDDRQVMQFMGDLFSKNNLHAHYLGPDHIRWKDGLATSVLSRTEELNAILRFFPLEWLTTLPRQSKWREYFHTKVVSCNHPIAMLTQSKRLPLVWDQLVAKKDEWKKLLPRTVDPRQANRETGDWIYKPALGRVGEGISIKTVVPEKELKKITKAAKREPKNWVAQQMFYSHGFQTEENVEMHLCIGVFTVNGKRAGFYGRICPYARIDANAKDIPILIMKEGEHEL